MRTSYLNSIWFHVQKMSYLLEIFYVVINNLRKSWKCYSDLMCWLLRISLFWKNDEVYFHGWSELFSQTDVSFPYMSQVIHIYYDTFYLLHVKIGSTEWVWFSSLLQVFSKAVSLSQVYNTTLLILNTVIEIRIYNNSPPKCMQSWHIWFNKTSSVFVYGRVTFS